MNGFENKLRDDYFSGSSHELQKIKSTESLQKFVRHNRTKKRFSRLTYILVFAVLTAIFMIICLAVFFKIKTIEVVGSARYSAGEIIAQTDIEIGQGLYEVNQSDAQAIISKLIYVKNVNITRKLPYTLIITVTEDKPSFYTELYGEYFALSSDMKVLERRYEDSFSEEGLVKLLLPEISSAIVGAQIKFAEDSSLTYVGAYTQVLLENPLVSRITAVDLRDKFDIELICDSIYLIGLGSGEDLATKLNAASALLGTAAFSDGTAAVIDANNPAECSAVISAKSIIEFDE